MTDLKRLSEITDEERAGWDWICIETDPSVQDPCYIRGVKIPKLSPAPAGYKWSEVTAVGDAEKKYILVLDEG